MRSKTLLLYVGVCKIKKKERKVKTGVSTHERSRVHNTLLNTGEF